MHKYFILSGVIILITFFSVSPAEAALVGTTNNATLTLTPQTGTYNINDTFSVGVYVNTHSQNVVVVAAYLNYDKTHFQAVSIDTTNSIFTMEAEKTIDATNGVIKITRGSPSPGVNTASGLVATINFKALSATAPSADNLTFQFSAGSTLDSNVILNDGLGTEILSGVYNGMYTVNGATGGDITPPVISSVNVSSITSSSATISWTTNELADTQVDYGLTTSYANQTTLNSSLVTSHSQTISSFNPSTTYYYRARSKDAAGNLALSGDYTFTTIAAAATSTQTNNNNDTQAPSTPTNLSAAAVSSTQINLSWTASTDNVGVVGYHIYRNNVQIADSPNTSYNDTALSPSTSYTYAVSAYDAANNGSYASTAVTATTQAGANTTQNNLSVTVTVTASPSSGPAPLVSTITATVGGTASGNINYIIYCDRSDAGVDITFNYYYKFDNQVQTSETATCTYSSTGTYSPKVIVQRGSSSAEARATVTVGGAGVNSNPTPTPTPNPNPTPNPAPVPIPSSFRFGHVINYGMKYDDVIKLQQLLSQDRSIYPEGLVTGYFGNLTRIAVQRFQCKNNIICYGDETTTGYGSVGPKTRATLNSLIK